MKPNATARLPAHRVHDGGLSAVRASNRAGTCIAHDEKCNVNASVSSVTARRDGTDPHYMTAEEEQRVIDRNREEKLLALDGQADEWIAYLYELANAQVKAQIKTNILQAAGCFQQLREALKGA